jgi:leucyl-tRNA synthetase
MRKGFNNKTESFKKLDDKTFEIKIIETIENEIITKTSIEDIRSQIQAKQKAIESTENQKTKKIAEADATIEMLNKQIETLNSLIDEATAAGIIE